MENLAKTGFARLGLTLSLHLYLALLAGVVSVSFRKKLGY
jgi:hypothetical protein